MSALVLGSRSRISNAIVRGLGLAGVEVYTADAARMTRSGFSKFTLRHFTITPPHISKEKFFLDLRKIIEVTKASVLFSGDEHLYYFLVKNKCLISDIIELFSPSYEQIARVRTKDCLISLAKEMNILSPKSIIIRHPDDVFEISSNIKFPVVFKPIGESSGRGLLFVERKADLCSGIKIRDLSNGYVVQEYIDGDNYGVGMIFNRGELSASICYKQVHQYPVSGGTPTLTEVSCLCPPVKMLAEILGRLRWHGVCQADFIHARSTSKFYIIDINPRLFGALYTTIVAGINFPFLMYRLATNNKKCEVEFQIKNSKIIWLEGEMRRFLNGMTKINKKTRSTLREDYKKITDIEDFSCYDLKPVIFAPLWFSSQLYRKNIEV